MACELASGIAELLFYGRKMVVWNQQGQHTSHVSLMFLRSVSSLTRSSSACRSASLCAASFHLITTSLSRHLFLVLAHNRELQ